MSETGLMARTALAAAGRSIVLRPLVVALMLLVAVTSAGAAPSDEQVARDASATLARIVRPDGPGAVVLIARGEQIVYRGARGMASIELGVAVAPDQAFAIASVTKMFTAALVLKLAEQGRLSLDDPLARFLPDFPGAGEVSLRQLLNHTAGISDRRIAPGPWPRDLTTAMLVADIARRPRDFAPGAEQRYSNAGFILLGAVIEQVTGKPWHVAITEQLLEPLGLARTHYAGSRLPVRGRVAGYSTGSPGSEVATASVNPGVSGAAGGLLSTADDLMRWLRLLARGRILGAGGFAPMARPAALAAGASSDPYGFGIYIWQVRGETMIGHTGQIDGFASALVYLPAQDVTIVVLANDDNLDARGFVRRLAAIALGSPYTAPVPVPFALEDIASLAGSYRVDGTTLLALTPRDGTLYAQRGQRDPIPLQKADNGELHFVPAELSYFRPVRDASGSVIRLDYFRDGDGPAIPYPRIRTPSP